MLAIWPLIPLPFLSPAWTSKNIVVFPVRSAGKETACNAGDPGSIPASGRSSGEGIGYPLLYSWASLAQTVKNPHVRWDTWFNPWVGKIPWKRAKIPWRRAWQPTPAFFPGESPWTEEPGRLQFMGSQRVRYDWAMKHTHTHTHTHFIYFIIFKPKTVTFYYPFSFQFY